METRFTSTEHNPHARFDRRARSFCRFVARAIETAPDNRIINMALERIDEARRRQIKSPLLDAWSRILRSGDWKIIRHWLVADGDRETQLRQENPFINALDMKTIEKIRRKYDSMGQKNVQTSNNNGNS